MDRRTDGEVSAVRGSKAQQQVLVTKGAAPALLLGMTAGRIPWGASQRIRRELSYLVFTCFRQNPRLCVHMHAHTHTQQSPTHYPDPGTHQTHLAKL